MANGDYELDEKTWAALPVERQLWLIFSEFNQQRKECHAEFCRINQELHDKAEQNDLSELATKFDRRKKVDTQFAGMMGMVGGLVGFLSSKFFGVFK